MRTNPHLTGMMSPLYDSAEPSAALRREGRLDGRKGLRNAVDLIRGMRRAHAASEQTPAIGGGWRQDHVHVHALLEETVLAGDRFFSSAEPDCNDRTGFGPQSASQLFQRIIQPPRVIPTSNTQLRIC